MRKILVTAVTLVLLLFLIPLLLPGPDKASPQGTPPPSSAQKIEDLSSGRTLRVLLDGTVREMDVNQYLWGVVAAEMPASFELEALKAQAVAARTYAMQRAQWTNQSHPDADICGDHRCCQAYISPEKAAQNWGSKAEENTQKILRAVQETGTEVILYDSKLISAVFHSSSASQTLDAVQVWGNSVPYLVGVKSPEGDDVPNYHTEAKISAQDFKKTFLAAHAEAVLEGAPSGWFGEAERSAGGSVSRILVGGVPVKGTELRTLFSLRSTAFSIETTDSEITFRVTGFGHGVGMSQYGANTMAKEGKSYRDILCWYYTGVTVAPCPAELWNKKPAN